MNKNKTRKSYRKPQLEVLGDLRTLTLGGSPGVGDSAGNPTSEKTPYSGMPQPDFFPPLPEDFPKPGDPPQL